VAAAQQISDFARLEHVRAAAASALHPHVKLISDELFLLRYPKQSCRRYIANFDARAALQVAPFAACRMPTRMCFNAVSSSQLSCCSRDAARAKLFFGFIFHPTAAGRKDFGTCERDLKKWLARHVCDV
jgi:hypothetical protein